MTSVIIELAVMFIFAPLLLLGFAAGCHPSCSWTCSSPPCVAVCQAQCAEPQCVYSCEESSPPSPVTAECMSLIPVCRISCPANQCEQEACPVCEALCDPQPTMCANAFCVIQCQEPNCQWACHTPTNCQHPKCELNCEAPACEATSDAASLGLSVLGLLLFVFLV